jgi:hypothetical protein
MAGMDIDVLAEGEQPGRRRLHRVPSFTPIFLTNRTGVDLVEGDVVAISLSDSGSVELVNRWRSTRQFVVATSKISAGADGAFVLNGYCNVKVNVTTVVEIGTVLDKDDADRQVVTRSTVRVADDVTPPRFALGYLTQRVTVAAVDVYPCFWWGVPSYSDNARSDVTIRDDFLGIECTAAPGIGALVRAAYPWWTTGGNPTTDQAANGLFSVIGDGGTLGAMYLSKDGTVTIATPVQRAFEIIRMRWAQRTATAATRRIGAMSAFAGADPTDGIYCRHTAGGSIVAVARSGGVESTLDTGIFTADGAFHDVELRVRNTQTVYVYVDGAYIGVVSLNVPVTALGLGAHCSGTTANVGLIVDRLEVLSDRI